MKNWMLYFFLGGGEEKNYFKNLSLMDQEQHTKIVFLTYEDTYVLCLLGHPFTCFDL